MALNLDGDDFGSGALAAEGTSSITAGLYREQTSVTQAVIIAAGNGSRLQGYQNGSPKPLLKVGGLHLLERVILSAKKVGVTDFVIVIGYQAARIRKTINAKKLGVKITWVRNIEWRKPNGVSVLKAERFVGGKFLLFMSDHIFDPQTLSDLRRVELGKDGGLLCVDHNLNRVPNLDDATKVRTEGTRLVNLDKSLTDFNAIDTGIFLLTQELFDALRQSQLRGDDSLSGGIRVLAEEGRMRTWDIGDKFWQDVDTVPDARHAERLLLHSTRSKGDGVIAKTINRKVSNFITKWLLKTPITPNQISIFNFIFSLFTAWVVSHGKPVTTIAAGFMFQLSSILDGCDGEVAQIKLRTSKVGAAIDTVTDHLSYMTFVIGVTIGTYHASGSPVVFYIAGSLIVSVLFSLNLGRIYIKRKNTASLRTLDTDIASLNHAEQKRWYLKFVGYVHSLGRRDMFSFVAMLIMFSGSITIFFAGVMGTLVLLSGGIGVSSLYLLSRKPVLQ